MVIRLCHPGAEAQAFRIDISIASLPATEPVRSRVIHGFGSEVGTGQWIPQSYYYCCGGYCIPYHIIIIHNYLNTLSLLFLTRDTPSSSFSWAPPRLPVKSSSWKDGIMVVGRNIRDCDDSAPPLPREWSYHTSKHQFTKIPTLCLTLPS